MLYAKLGGAWADDSYELNLTRFGLGIVTTDQTRSGWTVGAGIEHALAPNWSVKVEYNYLDFGSKDVAFNIPPPPNVLKIDQELHVAKLGVNYRFGWGPVIARH